MSIYSFNPVKILKFSDQTKLQVPAWIKSIQNTILDLEFFELVKNVSASLSREEEERIVKSEIQKLKISFSQIDKPDLRSTNFLEVASALTALARLVDRETIPAFIPRVTELLKTSNRPIVRKKCVVALHRFYLVDASLLDNAMQDNLRMAMSDKDPSVMAAAIAMFLDISKSTTAAPSIVNLIPSFNSILKQVAEGRLPRHYLYHGVPNPWLQVYLLKILENLYITTASSSPDKKKQISDLISPTVNFTLEQSLKFKNNAGYSIVYESIRVLTVVAHQDAALLESAIKNISVLLSHRYNNLRYLGINALSSIVQISPRSVTGHQLEVIECLESRDETLKRKSLDLLYRMTNNKNVVPICAKLIDHLMTDDQLLKRELVSRISDLAERYSPNDYWYIETMLRMLSVEGDLMSEESGFNLIRLVAGGTGLDDNEQEDIKIKLHAASLCWTILNDIIIQQQGDIQQQQQQQHTTTTHININVNDLLMKVVCWILSEYSYLFVDASAKEQIKVSLNSVINALVDQMDRDYSGDVKSCILTGLAKLSSQVGKVLPQVLMVANRYSNARSLATQKKSLELIELSKLPHSILDEVLPTDGYCEDLDMAQLESVIVRHAKAAISKGWSKSYIPKQSRPSTFMNPNQLVDLPVIGNQLSSSSTTTSSTHQQPPKKELNFEYPSPPTHFMMQQQKQYPTATIFSQDNNSSSGQQAIVPVPKKDIEIVQVDSSSSSSIAIDPVVPKPNKVVWTKKGFIGYQSPPLPSTTPQQQDQQNQALSTNSVVSPQPTSPTNKQPAVEPVAAQPSLETLKKEKLAKELFGGVVGNEDGNSGESRVNRMHGKKTTTTTATTTRSSNLFTGDDNEMLVNLSLGETNVQSSSTQSPSPSPSKSTSTTSTTQLLDLESPTNIVKVPTIQAELMELVPPASSILDTDDSDNNTTSTTTLTTITSPSLKSQLSTQINPGTSFNIQNLNLSSILRKYINNTNLENIVNQQIYSDNNIVISTIKQFNNSQLHLLLLISNNQSTKSLKNINQKITGNDHLKLDYDGDSIVKIHSNTLSVDDLYPKLTVVEIIKIDLKKVGFGISINLNIDFNLDGQSSKTIPTLSIPIEISDFLRPLDIGLNQFEQTWSSYSQEREIIVDSSLQQKSSQLLTCFIKGLHLHTIQPLDSDNHTEFFGATQLKVNSNIAAGGITLFKLGYNGGRLTISLKTNDKNFSDVISRHCYKIHNSSIIALKK
ncbi:adaptin N-terminal domain-containing protein [Heterostelium album PN500]|uniref:Adaptin N-terminal domain-containing protein n=1 Tax=Heterostelium pallidum (strain ATCC 26659 / Pp 5 / PN500) TaxID=670386 RepID=D3BA10_HETP5|nr:adaptin N-terminal domain-containing protein [Heterostelium album PN500]EFA81397.1 adaptin N-terminal domain-containing protein [Heterostelium album PN500]|eukprot:XP_020433515.1 adaptin N-terminal domain-containing protein [Heterostelium album PN500]